MEVEVSCHYIRRVRLSDVPLQQCGQQHPFRAVLPLSGDIVLGALNVALTEKMTCFSEAAEKVPLHIQNTLQLFFDSCRIFCIFILLINSKIYASNTRRDTIFRVLCTL